MRLQSELGIKQANLVGATLGMGAPLSDVVYTGALGTPYATLGEGLVAGTSVLADYTASPGHVDAISSAFAIGLGALEEIGPIDTFTSRLGENNSVAALTLVYGYGSQTPGGTIHTLTASDTITFSQTNARELAKVLTASDTLTLVQTNQREGTFSPSASNTIVFTQSNGVAGPRPVTNQNTITFTQTVHMQLYVLTASNTITFSQNAHVGEVLELTASDTITFSQLAQPGLVTRTARNILPLTQSAHRFFLNQDAIPLTASDTITFTQTNNRYILGVGATSLTATHTLVFTQRAIFPIELTAENSITFANGPNTIDFTKSATQEIEFTQSAYLNTVRARTASNTLNLSHSFTYLQYRDGIPIVPEGGCNVKQQYSPFGGGDTAGGIRPVPPTLVKKDDVVFYFPVGSECAATNSMTLRTPNFGDRDRNHYTRINRESRGGSLRIFRDPDWPSQRVLAMDFSGITDAEVDNILAFFQATLGQKVSFRDWQGRVWTGIITTPEASVIFTGRNNNDLAVELEVDDDEMQFAVCHELTFTQSASVVKV